MYVNYEWVLSCDTFKFEWMDIDGSNGMDIDCNCDA